MNNDELMIKTTMAAIDVIEEDRGKFQPSKGALGDSLANELDRVISGALANYDAECEPAAD